VSDPQPTVGERLSAGESVSLDPAPAPDTLPCGRCGLPLPEMTEEAADALRAAIAAGAEVVLQHEVCPGTEPEKPAGRYFEVRVQVVEVTEVNHGFDDDPRVVVTEMMSFVHGHRAVDLAEAMRPLALGLGEKWQLGEKQARIADADRAAAGS
jgi:hypothetical protein